MDSLLGQSRTPDEVVVVDGGSSDRTVQLLQGYGARYSHLNVILAHQANIAEGRNLSIAQARYDHIASADAGVEYPKTWLENLLRPFEADSTTDVVSGFFEPKSQTLFEECIGQLLYPKRDLMDWQKFLPSCRSVAFKRRVWEGLGGYAEWLPRGIGEDTHFFLRAQKAGCKFAYAPDATCYWRPRQNYRKLFKQYFFYSKGASAGRSSTFMFEAYGANPLAFTARNLGTLAREGKLLHLCVSLSILAVVLVAKITGYIAGVTQRPQKSP
jgi:cellulose synthase/poly-beta-1,6-N-acetylglucosamine synthase-like glycosyltransferase